MLHALSIRNFAIVEQLELTFGEGLTIITGETGAGKSILVDALGLALGDRADSGVVRQGCAEAEISAAFEAPRPVLDWLATRGLDAEDECLARRSIAANGRSRAYINGHLSTVQVLRELGEQLIDIHGQHAHQSLLRGDNQREIVDGMAPDAGLLGTLEQCWQAWRALRRELDETGGSAADREARLALLKYQVEEMEALELSLEAIQELEEEHRRLAHGSQLADGGHQSLEWLAGESGGAALNSLHLAARELEALLQHDERLQPIIELLQTAVIQGEEAAAELRRYLDRLDMDPERLAWVENRLASLQDMARKHRVSVSELPAHFDNLRRQLDHLENYEARARDLEQRLEAALRAYRQAAEAVSRQRRATAADLEQRISANMHRLGMPKGRLAIQVEVDPEAPPARHGMDTVEFLVSANPGQEPRPLGKVASGGELSRISLAIQVITAQHSGVPTQIFDEVDVGVGGGVAEIVGQQLATLGEQRQVLCITHLPQVAAYGRHHLRVSKIAEADRTQTQIQLLDDHQRVEEIARMLGGLEITEQTLAHAREMLGWQQGARKRREKSGKA